MCSIGSLKTPQLLELSGIGDRNILNPLGIETVIDLPGVGANLRKFSLQETHSRMTEILKEDHVLVPTIVEIDDGVPSIETQGEREKQWSI